ncbi:MAG: hypothetical protein GEU83_19680 [Pseudonocardiaceae bacterium]|nr:hypothetical protein [Pseudonocardiaceae bacterium]
MVAARRPWLGRWRRTRAARDTADVLDRLVEAELDFLRRLPVHLRSRPAEALAVLVMLAQDHRYYVLGWLSRRELRRRSERALSDLDALRVSFDMMGPPR